MRNTFTMSLFPRPLQLCNCKLVNSRTNIVCSGHLLAHLAHIPLAIRRAPFCYWCASELVFSLRSKDPRIPLYSVLLVLVQIALEVAAVAAATEPFSLVTDSGFRFGSWGSCLPEMERSCCPLHALIRASSYRYHQGKGPSHPFNVGDGDGGSSHGDSRRL